MVIHTIGYEYDTQMEGFDEIRAKHREYLASLHADGELLASGPWGSTGGLLVVAADEDRAGEIRAADPIFAAGATVKSAIRPWKVTLGPWS